MKFKKYQEEALKFAEYSNNLYPFLGLAEEAGEVISYVAKASRGDDLIERYGSEKKIQELAKKELGDVLWMLTACCHEFDLTLDDVANTNLRKLAARKVANSIKGTGDDR